MSSKETETVQCKYTDRHRQAEPYIETVWPTKITAEEALCQLQHRLKFQTVRFMRGRWSRQLNVKGGGVSAAVGQTGRSLYM